MYTALISLYAPLMCAATGLQSMLSSFWFVLLLGLALALATNHREDEAKEDAKSVDLY